MATLYNKTALNKIKKADLIQMFLDQQAKLNDIKIGFERVCNGLKSLQEENDKLEEENKKLKRANELNAELHNTCEKTIGVLEKENKKLKEQLKEPKELFLYKAKVKELKEENEKLKDQFYAIKSFLEVCDQNPSGMHIHYETRQIASRLVHFE